MNVTKRSAIALASGLAILVTLGCSTQAPKADADTQNPTANKTNTGELNLYSSRHYDTDNALYQKFTQQTGIKVNLIEGKADELIERIKSEGANSPADVLITVDAGGFWRAQKQGVLQPISSAKLDSAVPANLRSPEGYWFGLAKRARVIVYNKDKVKPDQLSTYEALAQPQWKGRVCVRSSDNIYNQSLVASKIESLGAAKTEEWAKGLVGNFARPPEGNDTAQIKAVAAGQCDVAIVNHYYMARLKQSKDANEQTAATKVGVFFPNQNEGGTHVNISGAAVTAKAPHKDNAIKFIEYLATPEAQEIFANGSYEYPVVSGLKPNPVVAEFGNFKESNLKVAVYGEKNPEAVKLMDKAGWK
jgi:iron(III) transport system substrate-binding protein